MSYKRQFVLGTICLGKEKFSGSQEEKKNQATKKVALKEKLLAQYVRDDEVVRGEKAVWSVVRKEEITGEK